MAVTSSLFLLLTFIVNLMMASSLTHECVRVPKMCYQVISDNYTHMRLPNMLNHTRRKDVTDELSVWNRLLQSSKCNAGNQLKYFLCFTYAPVCVENQSMDKLIPPCRSMCQSVRRACEPIMKKHGYTWPRVFDCDKKERFYDDASQMCISMNILKSRSAAQTAQDRRCSCKKDYRQNSLNSWIQKSDFVVRGVVQSKLGTVNSESDKFQIMVKVSRVLSCLKGKSHISKLFREKHPVIKMTVFNHKPCRCHRLRNKVKKKSRVHYIFMGREVAGECQVVAVTKMKDIPNSLKKGKRCAKNRKNT